MSWAIRFIADFWRQFCIISVHFKEIKYFRHRVEIAFFLWGNDRLHPTLHDEKPALQGTPFRQFFAPQNQIVRKKEIELVPNIFNMFLSTQLSVKSAINLVVEDIFKSVSGSCIFLFFRHVWSGGDILR